MTDFTSKDADWDECVVPVLNDYVGRMKAAGYREDQRKHVLLNALAIYDKKVMLDSEGKIPLNPTYHGLQLYLLIMGVGVDSRMKKNFFSKGVPRKMKI